MAAKGAIKKTIKVIDGLVSISVLTVIVAMLTFAVYALWDSKQMFQAADKSNYAVYKPAPGRTPTGIGSEPFKALQVINPEVVAWLSVYGTNIDYPVTQGQSNWKYVNTNAEGQYSFTGAIFLDSDNDMGFNDYINILYGHHMEKKVMFGEIGEFYDKEVFDSHRYGNLYFNEKNHGVEFFAFVHTDAYDRKVFSVYSPDEVHLQAYLDGLLSKAVNIRDFEFNAGDRLILLSTCSSRSTNGRDILVGKFNDATFKDPFLSRENENRGWNFMGINYGDSGNSVMIPWWLPALALLLFMRLTAHAVALINGRKKI
jgi:sortase B